jgi:glycerol-3-phosphate acyltransferase PlsY
VNWVLVVAAYLLGAFPTSYVLARTMKGIDLRQYGSGNLGATNAYRVLGWKAAIPIFIIDIAKGWAPAALFPHWDRQAAPEWALAYGTAAILGHVFSPYVGFRGGKGVATGAGVFLALAPLAVGVGVVVWASLVAVTGYVSLASIVAALTVPPIILLVRGADAVFWLGVAVAGFVIYAHRTNIRRLLRGEEHRFRRGEKATP